MSYAEAGDSIVNNARKGYKYFGYDLYLGGSQIYIGLDHADCQWFGAGAYLRTDYMQVIDCETGAITNRLERNKWIRIVYNLDYYLNDSSYVAFAETGFFYAQSELRLALVYRQRTLVSRRRVLRSRRSR
ncbi:MAG: hypothetical protein ACLUSP_03160 [Christensenellales bacterium]